VSLISDALRKARQEAAQGDARLLQPPPGPPARREPRRSGLGIGVVVGILFGSLAALTGGVAVWWVLGPHAGEVASVQRVEAPIATGVPAPNPELGNASSPAAGTTRAPAPPAAEAPDVAPSRLDPTPIVSAAGGPRGRDGGGRDPGLGDSSPLRLADPAGKGSEPGVARQAAAVAPEGGVFVLDADLGDVSLNLGYIIFKASDPTAEINGQEVRVGSHVAGFRVDVIEETRVTLRDASRTVVLSTR